MQINLINGNKVTLNEIIEIKSDVKVQIKNDSVEFCLINEIVKFMPVEFFDRIDITGTFIKCVDFVYEFFNAEHEHFGKTNLEFIIANNENNENMGYLVYKLIHEMVSKIFNLLKDDLNGATYDVKVYTDYLFCLLNKTMPMLHCTFLEALEKNHKKDALCKIN